jgi:peptide/nickel transport system ATP-binding protein
MKVCAAKHPIEVVQSGQRVSCWLHGPESEIPPGGEEPLERGEIGIAEEA